MAPAKFSKCLCRPFPRTVACDTIGPRCDNACGQAVVETTLDQMAKLIRVGRGEVRRENLIFIYF